MRFIRSGLWRISSIGALALVLATGQSAMGFGNKSSGHTSAKQLEWENKGQPDFSGGATSIAVKGDYAVASGTTCDDRDNCTWYVRAHNRWTGTTLWQDRLRDPVFFDLAKTVAISKSRVFAAGWVYEPPVGFQFVARAYDLYSGALLWDRRFDHGFGGDTAKVVCVDGDRVFVGGYFNPRAQEYDFTVVAFDGATGTELWESQPDPTKFPNSADWDITATEGRVYAAGEYQGGMQIRANDEATGAVLWERAVLNAENFASPDSLAVSDGRVFLAATQGNAQFIVRAFDAKSGAPLWSNDVNNKINESSQGTAVAVSGGRVFAAGVSGCNPSTGVECELLVRAHDPKTGALLWEAKNRSSGNDWTVYGGLAAGDGEVAVAGQSRNTAGRYDGEVRVYDLQTGRLRWRDTFNGGGDSVNDPGEMMIDLGYLYTAGQISRPDNGSDFLVRAYRAYGGGFNQ